tara:strand:- start:1129 stop:1281 length:153 start_codon:yes stop_codon:yes gene_type:complete
MQNESNQRARNEPSTGLDIIRNSTVEPIAENLYEQESDFNRNYESKTKRL